MDPNHDLNHGMMANILYKLDEIVDFLVIARMIHSVHQFIYLYFLAMTGKKQFCTAAAR
jgi:hypothetical protein